MQKFLCKACILSNGQQGRTPLENTDSYIRMLFVDLITDWKKIYISHIYKYVLRSNAQSVQIGSDTSSTFVLPTEAARAVCSAGWTVLGSWESELSLVIAHLHAWLRTGRLYTGWLKPPRASLLGTHLQSISGIGKVRCLHRAQRILKGWSPCCHLAKDTEVHVAITPDCGAAL